MNEINLNSAINSFLNYLEASGLSKNTIYFYSRDLNLLSEQLGNINLVILNDEMLYKHIVFIKNNGVNSTVRSDNTINRIKSAYRSFFKWCFIKNYTEKDFAVTIRLSKSHSKSTAPISQEEIIKLLNIISTSADPLSSRDKALFSIYAFSGIRKSEALSLKICDYDKHGKNLCIPKSKGGAQKRQIIPLILIKVLDEYLSSNFKNIASSFPLFPGQSPNIFLSGRQISNRFEKWKKIACIRNDLTIHSFRASYASQLYKISKDPLLVSYALGHSSFNTTKRYIKEDFFNISAILEKTFCFKNL